jgi:hypothetical protein
VPFARKILSIRIDLLLLEFLTTKYFVALPIDVKTVSKLTVSVKILIYPLDHL